MAVVPPEAKAKRIKVKQIRSGIGHADTMRRTLAALGLQHHQMTVELPNNASVRGMITKVRHLVEVTPAK
jgi:large subunit ribosomal protein L30